MRRGATTPDGTFRVFAGLRSDPFLLAWLVGELKPFRNLLEHDNVLCFLVDFDTQRVLDPAQGSLFGVIAETTPVPAAGAFVGHQVARFDWVGRTEQTNVRLNNAHLKGADDLRDLWNQQTPFAIAPEFAPIFRKRLFDSLQEYDLRDGKADWSPAQLAASANVFLDDFMLIDVAKPTTDTSFLEIEKSTLNGRPYQTGGGRTINAHDIDILLTWIVNRDREPLKGGATQATQLGRNTFPYLAPPNAELQTVAESMVAQCAGRQGLGADRPVRRHVAPVDCADPADRDWRWPAAHGRNHRRQDHHRAARRHRQRASAVSLLRRHRHGCVELHRGPGGHAQGQWQHGDLARAVPVGWTTDPHHQDHRRHLAEGGPRRPEEALRVIAMSQAAEVELERAAVTAGDIAAINLESARQRSWNRFWRAPEQAGIAELIVEQEQLTAQFAGDLAAFDRLEMLANELACADPASARTALIAAQVACSTHRFAEARESLAQAVARGAPSDATDRLSLSIDQATGENLSAVLAARRELAARPGHWDQRIPLGCAARRPGRLRRGRSNLPGRVAHVSGRVAVCAGLGRVSAGCAVGRKCAGATTGSGGELVPHAPSLTCRAT